jgi:hypothetical protein
VTRELKAIRDKRFLGHSIRCMNDVNFLRKRAESILIDCIKTIFCIFYGF